MNSKNKASFGNAINNSILSLQKVFAVALLLSGFAALSYQVAWQRVLTQVIGSDAVSMTLVVTIFMICLGVGSELAKVLVQRFPMHALRLYSIIEIFIGFYGFFSVEIIRSINEKLSGLTGESLAGDFLLNLLLLSVPIIGMGLTTPLIIHVAKQNFQTLGRTVGRLYAWNIAGAALGAALTGIILIEILGLDGTAKIAALINILAAFVAISVLRISASGVNIQYHSESHRPHMQFSHSIAAIFFGFGTLAIQVIFFRVLSNYLTLSPIVFPMLLCAYLCLMSLGQWVGGQLADRFLNQLTYVISVLFLFGSLLFLASLHFPSSWAAYLGALRFTTFNGQLISRDYPELIGDPSPLTVLAFSLLIMISVVAWSALFPVLFRLVTERIEDAGVRFARMYTLYTIGNMIGAFACGVFMLPLIGTGKSAMLTVLIVGAGVLFLASSGSNLEKYSRKTLVAAALGLFSAFFMPRNYYSSSFELGDYSVLDVFEGRTGVATVVPTSRFYTIIDMNRTASASALNTNPKPSDNYEAWRWNHSELMSFDKKFRPKDILVIGIGHAYLIDAMLDYSFVEKITVVDISAETISAVRKYTTSSTKRIFTDPRVEIVIADGRRYVQSAIKSGKKFDLIQNKINEPWHAGSSNLFTEEFFAEEKRLLKPDGYLSTRPLTGHLTDGLKVFDNAVWGGHYHMYFKNGVFHKPEFAAITPEIRKAWFAQLPGIDSKSHISRETVPITVFTSVPPEIKTDPNTDNRPTFEYYFMRKFLGTWVSPRIQLGDLNLKNYTTQLGVFVD